MAAATSNPPAFNLCAGQPVLDLVNTLDNRFRADGPVELLPDYEALLRFTEQSGLLGTAQVRSLSRRISKTEAERASDAARELREAAANALYAAADGAAAPTTDLQKLARFFQCARQRQELVWTPSERGSRFTWEWGASQNEGELPVWMLSLQTSALLTSDAMSRLRTCDSETCRWLFLDTSKNHTRRWCDMKICGNRMKARRYQARRM